MSGQTISFEIPGSLTGHADLVWDGTQTRESYEWWIIAKFGSVEVWRALWSTAAKDKPSPEDIDSVIADKLKGIFN